MLEPNFAGSALFLDSISGEFNLSKENNNDRES